MRWENHIESVVKKTKYLIYIFAKLAKTMQTKTLMTIYYAFFHSVISYGIIAWGGAYSSTLRVLQNIQYKILKIISKNSFIIQKYPLNLDKQFIFESLYFHYKTLKEKYLESISNTRNKSIELPKLTKTISKKSSYIIAILNFNKLPKGLKTLTCSKLTTKSKLKEWLRAN